MNRIPRLWELLYCPYTNGVMGMRTAPLPRYSWCSGYEGCSTAQLLMVQWVWELLHCPCSHGALGVRTGILIIEPIIKNKMKKFNRLYYQFSIYQKNKNIIPASLFLLVEFCWILLYHKSATDNSSYIQLESEKQFWTINYRPLRCNLTEITVRIKLNISIFAEPTKNVKYFILSNK